MILFLYRLSRNQQEKVYLRISLHSPSSKLLLNCGGLILNNQDRLRVHITNLFYQGIKIIGFKKMPTMLNIENKKIITNKSRILKP